MNINDLKEELEAKKRLPPMRLFVPQKKRPARAEVARPWRPSEKISEQHRKLGLLEFSLQNLLLP